MAGDSSLDSFVNGLIAIVYVFVATVFVLAFLAPQYIGLASNGFSYLIVDHIQGMIAGVILGAFTFGLLDRAEVEIGIGGFVFTISIGAIGGAIVQYLLFH